MKKRISGAVLLALLGTSTVALADAENAACGMTVCLSSSNLEDGGRDCKMNLDEFKKIKVKRKDGSINEAKTIKKRRDKLESCEGSERKDTEQIMARYGLLM